MTIIHYLRYRPSAARPESAVKPQRLEDVREWREAARGTQHYGRGVPFERRHVPSRWKRNTPRPMSTPNTVPLFGSNPVALIDAWVATNAKGKLVRQQVELGRLGAEEVEVQVEHCGLCHSDISVLNNEWGLSQFPAILALQRYFVRAFDFALFFRLFGLGFFRTRATV